MKSEKGKYDITYMGNLKLDTNELIRQKRTHRLCKGMVTTGERWVGGGTHSGTETDTHSTIQKIDNQQQPTGPTELRSGSCINEKGEESERGYRGMYN